MQHLCFSTSIHIHLYSYSHIDVYERTSDGKKDLSFSKLVPDWCSTLHHGVKLVEVHQRQHIL